MTLSWLGRTGVQSVGYASEIKVLVNKEDRVYRAHYH